MTDAVTFSDPPKKLVILLHGIMRSRTDMAPLSRYLKKRGFKCANILYPSRTMSLENLTEYVAEKIHAHKYYTKNCELYFVTHSMGGLVARYYIHKYKPDNLKGVVMLSPPNTGSDFADALLEHQHLGPLYQKIFGPAGSQLVTDYQHSDKEITYPLGIIAGSRNINPLALYFLPKAKVGKHDGIVPVERTKIKGMSDHIVMKSTHTFMMFNPLVMRQVYAFLTTGKFYHKNTPKKEKELVALLHGIANPGFIMTPIALWLEDHGYEILNIEYPSQSMDIDRMSTYIHRALIRHKYREYKATHFVAFSLGGLVLRSYLMRFKPSNLGRVIMLATPNRGTQAADMLKNEWYYKLIFGPAGQQLTTEIQSVYAHAPVEYELGIIAGSKSDLSPTNLLMKPLGKQLPEPNDGAVSVENTKLEGMKDHITVHNSHPMLLDDLTAKKQIVHFLQNGRFDHDLKD